MSLRAMILTSLSKEDLTGYDITKGFESAWGHVWHASHQQVYRELGKLNQEHLSTFTTVEQIDKPDKKTYSITPDGLRYLKNWFESPLKLKRINDEFAIKMFAGDIIDPKHIIRDINIFKQDCYKKLTTFNFIDEHIFKDIDKARSAYPLFAHISLRKGIIYQKAGIEWSDEALKRIHQAKLL